MSSYRGQTSHGTANMSAADVEAANRVRYMAHMERRARPPTFRPLTIVVVVLSIGLFVIGLIMIVIAHWPGVSGGESLKIAGGVLIAVGATVFIIAMAITCVLRNREQKRFEDSMKNIAASRSNMSIISRPTNQTTPTPSIDAKPGKSILKKTPSTSTYGTNRGSVFGEESDSGIPNNSFGQNHSYERDSDLSNNSSGKYEVYRIETLPDPGAARRGRNGALPQAPGGAGSLSGSGAGFGGLAGSGGLGGGPGLEHSSTDSEAQVVPTPVRNTKKRRGQSPSVTSGRQNTSYNAPDADQNKSAAAEDAERRRMQSYSNEGYDMYEGDGAHPRQQKSRRQDATDTTPESEERERRRQRRAKRTAAPADPNAVNVSVGSGAGVGVPGYAPTAFQNEAFQPQEADLGYSPPQVQQTVTTTTTRHVTRQTRDTRLNTSQLSSSMDDELKINIKAEPGTAVHITPTGTRKYKPARTVASPSQSSVETEI